MFGINELKERIELLEFENEILFSKFKKKKRNKIPHVNKADIDENYDVLRKKYRRE